MRWSKPPPEKVSKVSSERTVNTIFKLDTHCTIELIRRAKLAGSCYKRASQLSRRRILRPWTKLRLESEYLNILLRSVVVEFCLSGGFSLTKRVCLSICAIKSLIRHSLRVTACASTTRKPPRTRPRSTCPFKTALTNELLPQPDSPTTCKTLSVRSSVESVDAIL